MKLTRKLLIIGLIALPFFLKEPKNIVKTDTNRITISDNDSDYEQELKNKDARPYSLRDTKIM